VKNIKFKFKVLLYFLLAFIVINLFHRFFSDNKK